VRGKNYPQATGDASNGDKCRYTCTAKCQEEKKCGNRVDADTLDVVYTVDGNKIIYVSTGQPQEVSKPRRPLNHTYTTQTNPSFSWDRISTDQPGVADDVCYKLEIATTPLFRTGAVNDIVYEKPTGAPQWNPASYICTDQHVPDATGTWAAAYNGDKKLKNGEYYYWRVYPVNSAGMGFPSDVFEFGVDNQKPAAFDLLEPGSVAAPFPDPGTKTPTFKWQASCDAPLVRDPADASKCIRP